MKDIDEVSGDVIDVALHIHRELGPGLFESVYEMLLAGKLAAPSASPRLRVNQPEGPTNV